MVYRKQLFFPLKLPKLAVKGKENRLDKYSKINSYESLEGNKRTQARKTKLTNCK